MLWAGCNIIIRWLFYGVFQTGELVQVQTVEKHVLWKYVLISFLKTKQTKKLQKVRGRLPFFQQTACRAQPLTVGESRSVSELVQAGITDVVVENYRELCSMACHAAGDAQTCHTAEDSWTPEAC